MNREEVNEAKEYPLGDDDIEKLLGKTFIFSYPYLDDVAHIDDVFDKKGRSIMLFLTQDENTGHWICMHKNKEGIHYFDPYGIPPEGNKVWLNKEQLEELDQLHPRLIQLFRESGYPIFYNNHEFQIDKKGINTCGRHCVSRLYFKDLSLEQYKDMIDKSGLTPDDFVIKLTYDILKK
jgi:hypothetical protein